MDDISVRIKDEFIKNPEAKLEDLQNLQEWCSSKNFPALKDFELLQFHHSCLFDMKSTKKCIDAYFKIRRSAPELFSNRDVSKEPLKSYISRVLQCFPIGATQQGHQIIMYRLLNADASQHCFTLDIQLLSLAAEVIQHKAGTFPGITILTDFDKAGIRHMLWAKWGHLRVAMQYLQEGFPSRLESIQTLSSTAFVDYALIAIKPFTNSQVLNKMVYHNITNLNTLYEKIPKENLPSDYGGLLPSCDEINSDYMKEVISMKSYFDEKDALHNSSGVEFNK